MLSILPLINGSSANNFTMIGKFAQEAVTFSASQVGKIDLTFHGIATEDIYISFNFTDSSILHKIPTVVLKAGHNENISLELHPITFGYTVLFTNATPPTMVDLSEAYVHVSVSHSDSWDYVLQCVLYDRGDQKISRVAKIILGIITLCSFIMVMLGGNSVFQWLEVLYFVSFVKLFITLIKYIPQAFYNYRRKSTSGWSIGNVLLDFTGGTLSIAQMFVIAYNYNDWSSIFGDPTKFGLGLFSMIFDVLFIVQHYVLYRNGRSVLPPQHSPDQSLRDSTPLINDSVSSYGSVVR
ncbi:PQ-loop repeat [Trinorchestia longiramus]|nr:PQ-loop repeat [Trinorchestia longiramus]